VRAGRAVICINDLHQNDTPGMLCVQLAPPHSYAPLSPGYWGRWSLAWVDERMSETRFCWFWFIAGLASACHVRLDASPSLPPDCRLTPSPAACWLYVLTAVAAFDPALWHWDNVVWEFTSRGLRHAVRGLMRFYVSQLVQWWSGLSPRALLVQLQPWCFRRNVAGLPAKR